MKNIYNKANNIFLLGTQNTITLKNIAVSNITNLN